MEMGKIGEDKMAMNENAKEFLLEALDAICEDEEKNIVEGDASIKDVLVSTLDANTKNVLDAASETPIKRKRYRFSRNGLEECEAKDPTKCRVHGFAARAMEKAQLEREDKLNRINPSPDALRRKYVEYSSKLKGAKDAINPPYSHADVDSIEDDIKGLCQEAGIKNYKDRSKYQEYRQRRTEYRQLEEVAKKEINEAERRLNSDKFDSLDDFIERLRGRGKQIDDAYDEVLGALHSLYDEICDEIDAAEKGLKVGGLREVEKEQFGMLKGETGKLYQARMRGLGRGKEIPETIKRVDTMVEQAERRWQRVAALSPQEFETVKANWRKTVFNLLGRTALATNSFPEGLNGILEGHLKSQHELAEKGKLFDNPHPESGVWGIIGGNENMPRYRFTRKVFGTKPGMSEEQYEKYGCLHTRMPVKDDNYTGGQYGRNVIRWKPGTVCATMFCGDSICLSGDGINYCTCSPISNPSPASFNPKNRQAIEELKKGPLNFGLKSLCRLFGTPYIEIQLHGANRPTAEEIESISFNSKADMAMLSPMAVAKIRELNIPTYIQDRETHLGKGMSRE